MLSNDFEVLKIIEVARPERILDAKSKTAMMTIATLADHYRIGEAWQPLQDWRFWAHNRPVNEVSHFGEYTTVQGDILSVCPLDSELVLCQVQVVEIRMVNCQQLTDAEVHELGYRTRHEYDEQWGEIASDAPRGWYMRVMLVPDVPSVLH